MGITSTLLGLLQTRTKGTSAAGFPTSKAVDANTQSLHVSVADQLPTGSNTVGAVLTSQSAVVTANITTATSIAGPVSVVGMNMVTAAMSGTYAGVSSYFEVTQDGNNWFLIQGRVSDGSIVNGWTNYTNTLVSIDISLGAWTQFRVRATTYTSGTAVVTIITKASDLDRTPSSLVVGYAPEGNPVYSFPPVLMGGTDGVNARMARFKPANTAPLSTDPALVVTDRGNPAGVSVLGGRWLVSDGFNSGAVDPNTFSSTGNPSAPVFGATFVDLSMTVTTASAIKALETVALFTPVPGGTLGAFIRYQASSNAANTFAFAGFYDVSVAGAQPAFGAFLRTYSTTTEAVVRTQDRFGAIVESYVNVQAFLSVSSGVHITVTDSVVTFTINRQIAARIQIDASVSMTLPTMKVGVYSTNIGTGVLNTAYVDYIGVYNTGMNGQISDPVYPTRMATVSATGALKVGIDPANLGSQISASSLPVTLSPDQFLVNDISTNKDLLTQLLIEMRVMNLILHSTLQSRDDLDSLRIDAQSTINVT